MYILVRPGNLSCLIQVCAGPGRGLKPSNIFNSSIMFIRKFVSASEFIRACGEHWAVSNVKHYTEIVFNFFFFLNISTICSKTTLKIVMLVVVFSFTLKFGCFSQINLRNWIRRLNVGNSTYSKWTINYHIWKIEVSLCMCRIGLGCMLQCSVEVVKSPGLSLSGRLVWLPVNWTWRSSGRQYSERLKRWFIYISVLQRKY